MMKLPLKQELLSKVKNQLAIEYGCLPSDFDKPGPTFSEYRLNEGRRRFGADKEDVLKIASMGQGAVFAGSKKALLELEQLEETKGEGHRAFEPGSLQKIGAATGYALFMLALMHLPGESGFHPVLQRRCRWFFREDMAELYEHAPGMRNAVSYDLGSFRPDVIALAAYEGEKVVSLSGASMDTPELWQVGVDTLPAYRGEGLGAALVKLLTDRILDMGKIPYYGTGAGNIASRSLAMKCGYFPAWIEAY